jgi:hypothetical protein
MKPLSQFAKTRLDDITDFSEYFIERPLRRYQLAPVNAVLRSVLHQHGYEFLLIFPRQSGKNEAVAQLLVFLLNIHRQPGGNIVYGAIGDNKSLGIDRLEARLHNRLNAGDWTRRTKPDRRCLGNAAVIFLSSHPTASTRGQTAHHLLVIDETQEQTASHIEAVFTPMRAANNATALYIGTVKLTSDYLWQKKLELEREQRRDGIQRVWIVHPHQVIAENPPYRAFLDTQIRKHGRKHPIVASEYFLEPIDAAGRLFDARRQALMRGTHSRQHGPHPDAPSGALYVATLDVAGEDEGATDPIARLDHPGRDYTVATLFQVHYPAPACRQHQLAAPGPTFRALDVFVDHGSKHFADSALPGGATPSPSAQTGGGPSLVARLLAWLDHWQVAHILADETGVGQGIVSWLQAARGEQTVTGFNFSARGKKAELGSRFLSLIETGRFKYWSDEADGTPSEDQPGSDGWWFWRQATACTYEVPPEGRFDQDLRWFVPESHKTDTPAGPQPTHDDRLLCAALVAELDRRLRAGQIVLGTAQSAVLPPVDPLDPSQLHF